MRVLNYLWSWFLDYRVAGNLTIRHRVRYANAQRCLGAFLFRVVRAFNASDFGFERGCVQLIFNCRDVRHVAIGRARRFGFVDRLRNQDAYVEITDGGVLPFAFYHGSRFLAWFTEARRWGLLDRDVCVYLVFLAGGKRLEAERLLVPGFPSTGVICFVGCAVSLGRCLSRSMREGRPLPAQ